ncbi:MAG TPA: hypothetical protein VK742_10920 [Candidatus Sulfotelmatobacter sp.]|jgi:hypothetical protein|nr:hypothetical protein [Candidatus Sulfotelmatobacter sp.]
MFYVPARNAAGRQMVVALILFAAASLAAAPTGPTLQLDYGHGEPRGNPISQFMYFVPLISPEPVSVFTNTGNTQCARVLSFHCQTNCTTFLTTCEFDFTGQGAERNVFDHTHNIQKHEQELQAGGLLKHQLGSINVTGEGLGSVEIEGVLTNGQHVVNRVQFCFNRNGHASPVTINLHDIAWHNGAAQIENGMVARVNALTFRRSTTNPKMEVSLASLKQKDAGDGLWQNFYGSLKGAALNLFLPPLAVEPAGQQSMLDFGLTLATEQATFTFPLATTIKNNTPHAP